MKRGIILTVYFFFTIQIYSCSSFFINHNGQKLLCFNWDWPLNGNGYVFINQPNVLKTAFLLDSEKKLKWTSKYGSVTFNQIGCELPYCGLNEAGLAIAATSNNKMQYPERNEKYCLNESQWIQYLLDNCKTIDEAVETISIIQIIEQSAPIHYLIGDRDGDVAILEFVNGDLKIFRKEGLPYPVLTNDFYKNSIINLNHELETNTETKRFTKAVCDLNDLALNDTVGDYIEYSFGLLYKTHQKTTKWQIVLDLENLEVYFNTSKAKYAYFTLNEDGDFIKTDKKTKNKARVGLTTSERTNISFDSINFDCNNQTLFADLKSHNTQNIYTDLKVYRENIDNKRIYETIKLFQKMGFMNHISKKDINKYIDFLKQYACG